MNVVKRKLLADIVTQPNQNRKELVLIDRNITRLNGLSDSSFSGLFFENPRFFLSRRYAPLKELKKLSKQELEEMRDCYSFLSILIEQNHHVKSVDDVVNEFRYLEEAYYQFSKRIGTQLSSVKQDAKKTEFVIKHGVINEIKISTDRIYELLSRRRIPASQEYLDFSK